MNQTKATAREKTPAAAGYQMPAEWERHAATWIGWPHNRTDWPGKLTVIQWVYGEIVRKLAPGEIVRIIVNSESHEAGAQRVLEKVGVNLSRVEFFRFPTTRGWTRDFGPLFVSRRRTRSRVARVETAIVRFRFRAGEKYQDWQKDDGVPERLARALGCSIF